MSPLKTTSSGGLSVVNGGKPVKRSNLDFSTIDKMKPHSQASVDATHTTISSLPSNATVTSITIIFTKGVDVGFKNKVINDYKSTFSVSIFDIKQDNTDDSFLINNVLINYSIPTAGTPGVAGTAGTPGTSSELRLNPTLERESKTRTLETKPVELQF